MNRKTVWIIFTVSAFLVACGNDQARYGDQETAIAATIQAEQTSQPATQIPSATPTSAPTMTPTPAPVAAGNPVPFPSEPITCDNATRMMGLARWGKDQSVYGFAVSTDSELLAIETEQGIDVYDGETLQLIQHLDNTKSIYQDMPEFKTEPDLEKPFSPDGKYFLEETGPEVVERIIVPDPNFPNNKYKGEVAVYYFSLVEASSNQRKQTIESQFGGIVKAVFSPNGKSVAIVTGSDFDPGGSGALYFWDLELDRARLHNMGSIVKDLAFSPDGKYLAIALANSTFQVRKIVERNVSSNAGSYNELQIEKIATLDQSGIQEVHFLGSGKDLITISNNLAKVWELEGDSVTEVISFGESLIKNFGNDPVLDIAISPNAEHLATISDLGLVTIWQIGKGSPLTFWQSTQQGDIYGTGTAMRTEVGFTHDGEYLVILEDYEDSFEYAFAYKWSLKEEKIILQRDLGASRYSYWEEMEDLDFAALYDAEDELYVLDGGDEMILRQSSNFKEINRFRCMADSPSKLLFSPDKSLVFTYWRETEKPCQDQPALTEEVIIEEIEEWEDNLHLITWDFKGNPMAEKELDLDTILDWNISPDGRLLAILGSKQDNTLLEIIETASGKLVQQIPIAISSVYDYGWYDLSAMAFSPDSSLLAIGDIEEDGNILLLQVENGQLLHTLTGHMGTVLDIEFSQDGLWLATSSADGTIRLWGIP